MRERVASEARALWEGREGGKEGEKVSKAAAKHTHIHTKRFALPSLHPSRPRKPHTHVPARALLGGLLLPRARCSFKHRIIIVLVLVLVLHHLRIHNQALPSPHPSSLPSSGPPSLHHHPFVLLLVLHLINDCSIPDSCCHKRLCLHCRLACRPATTRLDRWLLPLLELLLLELMLQVG